jgi:PAS domain S-box-containing protein
MSVQPAPLRRPGGGVRAMLDLLADVVIQYDSEGRIIWCNQQLCSLMECEADDLIGKALPELGIDVPAHSHRGRNGDKAEGVVHTAQGLRWFSWSDVDLHDDDGITTHFAVARDITLSKQREAALVQARERAEQASLAKSQLLATVSHEIRTPMNGVLGMAGLLSCTALTPEQQTYVQAISTSAESLVKLVNELLDFSRIEAGRLVLEPQRVLIRELIEGVVELLAVKAFNKDLGLGCHVSPEVPEAVMVDPGRLRQILLNLLGNALNMTETGGVLVTARCPMEGQLVLTVEDTGPGMDPETVARLFREFEQGNERRARPESGAGLGLAITRRLVIAMGGEVGVETELRRGACFTVRLPIEGLELSHDKADAFSGLSVLIVTPRTIEGKALAMAVEAHAGEAILVESEAAAVTLIEEGMARFDMLVADALLEGESPSMLGRLRKKGLVVTRALTLIAPTDRSRLPSLRATGYDAFIARPPRGRTVLRLLSGDLPNSPMQPSMQKTKLRSSPTGQTFNVLLAEDNRINALLTEKALNSSGCQVTTVGTGAEAVETFINAQTGFNWVIVDLNLPDFSGVDVIKKIRAHESEAAGEPVPILVLSADGRQEMQERALACGATAFAQKPLDPTHLLSLLDKYGGVPPSSG